MGLLDIVRRVTLRQSAPSAAASSGRGLPAAPTRPAADAAPPASARQAPDGPVACRFFEYATGRACLDQRDISTSERQVLESLDRMLDNPGSVARWIPRPPAVLPRLLACLRDDEASLREACELIRADPYLAAEVLRLANAARQQHGAPVTELERAAVRLGTDGLRRAVGATLLRPLFDTLRDPLLGQALPRLWAHAQSKSGWCHALAPQNGVDSFDAYLAGLTHNLGWIGALKALGRDRPGPGPAAGYSSEFVLGLARRSERMFACSAQQWAINDALTRLGAALRECALQDAADALAQVLYKADTRATEELAAA